MAKPNPLPEGYPRVSAYLAVDGADAAIAFYRQIFGATERTRMATPDGTVAHAEIEIGDSVVMLSDPMPGVVIRSPKELGGTSVGMSVYVEDVDDTFERAVQAGATVRQPVQDQFYGDRSGQFDDPFGHHWNVASHVEDVAPEEMARRAAEAGGVG